MKTIINKWDLLEITVIFNETSEIARFTLKSVPIEDPETSRKSSKNITQAKTFPQVVGLAKILLVLYIVKRQKVNISWTKKMQK